jgi:hypothetical protein
VRISQRGIPQIAVESKIRLCLPWQLGIKMFLKARVLLQLKSLQAQQPQLELHSPLWGGPVMRLD